MATSTPPTTDSGTTLDSSNTSATAELYGAAMGPIGAQHYQRAFARIESSGGKRPGWNWAAALLTLNWMVFRGLWGAALVYSAAVVGAALLVFGIGRLVFAFDPVIEVALLALFALALVLAPGLLGDRLAYKACQRRVQRALAANATLPEACAMLRGQAVTRARLIGQSVANAVLAIVVIGLSMALPSMHAMPMGGERMTAARNVAVGRATDLSTLPGAASASASASASAAAPVSAPAVAPTPAASLALASGATPAATSALAASAAPAASAPAPAASAPAAAGKAPAASTARPAAASASAAQPSPAAGAAGPAVPAKALPALAPSPQRSRPAGKDAAVPPKAVSPAGKAPAGSPSKPQSAAAAPGSGTAPPSYQINVGLFADPNNALNAYTRLQDAGLPVSTREIKSAKGMLSRIRVGPFETEAEAERAADKIRALRLDAVIVSP